VRNAPDGKINFNGTDEDWVKMREAMIDVIQSGTGRGIRTSLYQIAGKTGTAQVKSIAQGKRYNEAALSERQLDHGFLLGLHLLINLKLLLQSFGKMVVMVVQQLNLRQYLITGY
jgi:penicillin-binding protein 2